LYNVGRVNGNSLELKAAERPVFEAVCCGATLFPFFP
jgi:hypothetical protein